MRMMTSRPERAGVRHGVLQPPTGSPAGYARGSSTPPQGGSRGSGTGTFSAGAL